MTADSLQTSSRWSHLILKAQQWRETPTLLEGFDGITAIHFSDGSTPMLLAASSAALREPVVAWLEIDERYPVSIAARDLGTLSWLVPLHGVVLSSYDGLVAEHAEIVWSLVDNANGDNVTMRNRAGNLNGAFNRPLPPNQVLIWSTEDAPENQTVTLTHLYPVPSANLASKTRIVHSTRRGFDQ